MCEMKIQESKTNEDSRLNPNFSSFNQMIFNNKNKRWKNATRLKMRFYKPTQKISGK